MKKKKITFKQRIKNFFLEEPKQNFWFWAFLTIVLFRYVSPLVVYFLIPFFVGLGAPDADMSQAMDNAGEKLAEAFTGVMELLFNAGQNIALENPLLSKVIFFGLSNFIWVIYSMAFILILNLLRYGTAWIYKKFRK